MNNRQGNARLPWTYNSFVQLSSPQMTECSIKCSVCEAHLSFQLNVQCREYIPLGNTKTSFNIRRSFDPKVHHSQKLRALSPTLRFHRNSSNSKNNQMASSSSTSARSTAAGSSSSASPPPALPTYSWEKAFERDTRVPQMHQFMEQILRANFPVVAQKLRKEEPPARRYEPTAPSQQRQVDGRPQTSVERASPVSQAALAPSKPPVPVTPLHPSAFQLHGYTSESSSEVDMREVDPMDELSDFETQLPPPLANSGGKNRKVVQLRDADDGDDDEMNGGGVNDFDMEGDNADVSGLLVAVGICTCMFAVHTGGY